MDSGVILVLTTVASDEEADQLARVLVEERLAACVNRLAVRSSYRWQGAVEEEGEVLLIIKATAELRGALEQRIAELSSYQLPEFLVVEAASVSEAYQRWLIEACSPPR